MGLENPLHILILIIILLLLFGAKKLPEMGRGLGEGIRSFKAGISGHDETPEPTPAPHDAAAPASATLPPAPAVEPAEDAQDATSVGNAA